MPSNHLRSDRGETKWLRSAESRGSGEEVRREMHRYKRGRAKSGRGGKGGKVKSRKQAIAIALSKARKKGKKVPRKKR
jgi:hypothetical protein